MKAHQRIIREKLLNREPFPNEVLAQARVVPISNGEAESIILKYEWLGTMATDTKFCYALKVASEVLAGPWRRTISAPSLRSPSVLLGERASHMRRGMRARSSCAMRAGRLIETSAKKSSSPTAIQTPGRLARSTKQSAGSTSAQQKRGAAS